MKNNKKNSLQNRTEDFYAEAGKQGNKKKSKATEVSRFISEGNPNTQGTLNKEQADPS